MALALAFGTRCVPYASAAPTLPLLYSDDFEHGMERWTTFDAKAAEPSFKVVELEGPEGKTTHALRALGTSQYQPPFRSPPNIALLKDVSVGEFELAAKVQSTNVDAGPHRDMCIVWGYQGPSHFYYVHFGAVATPDGNSCQIFIVDDAARRPISDKAPKGTPWTKDWHNVKVVRRVGDGTIEVYFDKMDKPFMTAHDTTFAWGRVGLGTFDDHGNWDDFKLYGALAKPEAETEARQTKPLTVSRDGQVRRSGSAPLPASRNATSHFAGAPMTRPFSRRRLFASS